MIRGVIAFALVVCGGFISAQTSPCPAPEDLSAKALKYYEKAAEAKKKTSTEERVEYLRAAVDLQDDYGLAFELLAKQLFKLSKRDSEYSYECKAATHKWRELCENHSSEAYYILGALAYMANDSENALLEFEKFMERSEGSEKSYIKRKRVEVAELLPQIKFEISYYANGGTYSPTPLPLTSLNNDEYLPALSPDGSILFFTRASNLKARGDVVTKRVEELVWSERHSPTENFDVGEALEYPFNEGDNYGGVSLSIDNRILIIAATNPHPKNPQNIDLFTTTYRVDGKDDQGRFFYYWDDLELLGPEINTVMGWESQPALSADGRELFFASARENSTADADGNPTMDLFVSVKDSAGVWGEAELLPGHISTEAQEKAPFLHPDGKTLYFSSDRVPSGGGYDLWVVRRDTLGVWGVPVNLGVPVNTSGDEHGLVVSSSGDEAFFASRRTGTRGLDIMSFPVPEELRPESVKVIHGKVDPTPPDDNVRLTLNYVQSRMAEEIELNMDDGSFAAIINTTRNEDVILKVEGDGVAFEAVVVHEVDGTNNVGDPQPEIELRAKKASKKDAFELRDVQFATNSAIMDNAARIVLQAFAEYLIAHPQYNVEIDGHTDNVGTTGENLRLSEERAEVVSLFLQNAGVDSRRLRSRGFGPSQPKAENGTEKGRALNRRTEFTVFEK
jgi:outer membrane protein OmpA-like peptidoglycan-associated protein/tetratricopeptide (TPR) repeat protein